MIAIQKADIVSVDFPFTDGSGVKRRPALVLSGEAINKSGDVLLMQITSKSGSEELSFALLPHHLSKPLPLSSFLRLHKIFSLDRTLVVKKLSSLNERQSEVVTQRLFELLK